STVFSACDYNTACKCPTGLPQGQYCGKQLGCNRTSVYECSPSGGTCEYGYRDSCALCDALTCNCTISTASCISKNDCDNYCTTNSQCCSGFTCINNVCS
ncbi:1962_t:CDS:2, partial [Dentiscutata heterogama]